MRRNNRRSLAQHVDMERRRFLRNTAQGLLALASASTLGNSLGLLNGKRAFAADARPRRHLINLIGWGGWDGVWWHNSLRMNDYRQLPNVCLSSVLGSTGLAASFAGGRPYALTDFGIDADLLSLGTVGGREQLAGKGFNHFFGPSGRARFTTDMLVWKGLLQQGQHGIGNRALNQGSTADYAKGYSALVAAHIAKTDYPRPLHYVSVAAHPSNLFTNTAMNQSYEVATCLPDWAVFRSITTRAGALTPAAMSEEQRLVSVVGDLGRVALSPRLNLTSSRVNADSLTNAFASGVQISNNGWGDSTEFRGVYARYVLAMIRGLRTLTLPLNNGPYRYDYRNSSSGEIYYPHSATVNLACSNLEAALPQTFFDDLNTLRLAQASASVLAALQASLTARVGQAANAIAAAEGIYHAGTLGSSPGVGIATIGKAAFPFAMADFLVRKDASAVVDLPIAVGDEHWMWWRGFAAVTTAMAGMAELIASLKEVSLTGGSLFDQTLIVAHTEMDRTWSLDPSEGPGQAHGNTASVLLAGMGINRGAVVGDVGRGPLENSQFAGNPWQTALPIDYATGAASASGKPCSVQSLLPTVCAIFGASVPQNQLNEFDAVPAVLRRS